MHGAPGVIPPMNEFLITAGHRQLDVMNAVNPDSAKDASWEPTVTLHIPRCG
jgi:hypothetical protein